MEDPLRLLGGTFSVLFFIGGLAWALCQGCLSSRDQVLQTAWTPCCRAVYVLVMLSFLAAAWGLQASLGFSVQIAGYVFATVGAAMPIARLLGEMWERVPRAYHPSGHPGFPWASFLLGSLERALYLGSLQLGKPEFIAAWFVLKLAGGWNYWRLQGKLYYLHLIGIGLSLAYAVVGWQYIQWATGQNCLNAVIGPPTRTSSIGTLGDAPLQLAAALALPAVVLVATVLAYCMVRHVSRTESPASVLSVVFNDGTERLYHNVTRDMICQLHEQQRDGSRDLCTLQDAGRRITIRLSGVRAWEFTPGDK